MKIVVNFACPLELQIFYLFILLFSKVSSFVTTLVLVGASGVLAPPVAFFPNKESGPRNIFDIETNGTNELPSDTIVKDNLLRYMRHTFYPWVMSKGSVFPVVIFIDIDPVHVSWSVLSFCTENRIILLSTTLALSLHPIKSYVLPLLKNAWTTELNEWNKTNNDQPIIESVPSILRQVFEKTITVDLLKTAFHKSGMFPFDPVNVFKETMLRSSSPVKTFYRVIQPDRTTKSTSEPVTEEMDQSTIEAGQSQPQQILQEYDPEAKEIDEISNSTSQQTFTSVPEQTIRPVSQLAETIQPTDRFQVLFGPLTYEFINASNFWNGAVENTSLFEVWQRLLRSHHHLIHPTHQRTTPSAVQEINQEFRMQFEGLIGPLVYEFKNSGNLWTGAVENTALFGVWKNLLNILEADESMQVH